MKIAMIVRQFPVLSQTFILNQIVGLIERGHDVDIYALEGVPSDTPKKHPDVEKYQLLHRTYYVPRIPKNLLWRLLKGLGLVTTHFSKDPLTLLRSLNVFKYGKQAASLKLLYTVIPSLGKGHYDIIHCQFGTLGLQGISFRQVRDPQAKLITSFRGFDISRYVKDWGDKVYDQLFKSGDFFLTNCDYFKHRIVKLGCDEEKVVVNRSGLDCSKFTFTPRYLSPDGRIRIATTGRLTEKKGIEYSIRSVAKLTKIYPNIEYTIIGDGELRDDFQQLIQTLGASEQIRLLGWKNQQEIIEILNESHIFVAPSVTAESGDQDAPINVLKEAMAMGLPVVSTYHGGIPELVEDGISGFLVPERDADALAEKLSYLVEHPEVWHQMGQAGRVCVEEYYDLNKLNDQLVAIYQNVLNLDDNQQLTPTKGASLMPT